MDLSPARRLRLNCEGEQVFTLRMKVPWKDYSYFTVQLLHGHLKLACVADDSFPKLPACAHCVVLIFLVFFFPRIYWWFSTVDVIETWRLSSSVQHLRSPGDVSIFFGHLLLRMTFIVETHFYAFQCSVFAVTVSIWVGIQWDLLFGIEGFRIISYWQKLGPSNRVDAFMFRVHKKLLGFK